MRIVGQIVDDNIAKQIEQIDGSKITELQNRIGHHLSGNAKLQSQSCVVFFDPGVAKRKFPSLFNDCDKDGLIAYSKLNCVSPGVFEKDGLILFAHQYFRRSLSRYNTLNDPFLGRLNKISKEHPDVRIALDEDLLGHPDTLTSTIELQYWWGPQFSDDLSEIKIGLCRHTADERDCFFNAISTSEFWWYVQDDRKTFECEEIRDLNVPSLGESGSEFGCRFVHSILNDSHDKSIHLDGAIRLYSEDLMLERVDKDLMHFGRRAKYTKIWRIDGELAVGHWKSLINDYYRDNHLIGEYFGASKELTKSLKSKTMTKSDVATIHDFSPCAMTKGDGVHIAISYHPHSNHALNRKITSLRQFDSAQGTFDYVDACTMEIMKLIKRRGESVELDSQVTIVAFDDLISNLPKFEHCGANSSHAAQITLDAINEYCTALSKTRDNRMICFHITIRYDDRDTCFSFSGHVDDMTLWLHSSESKLPHKQNEVSAWAESAYSFISKKFNVIEDDTCFENMIDDTGLITIKRKFIHRDDVFIENDKLCIKISPRTAPAIPFLRTGQLTGSNACVIKKSKCTACGQSYGDCHCIKLIDKDVVQIIEEGELIGYFWTDRSAWL